MTSPEVYTGVKEIVKREVFRLKVMEGECTLELSHYLKIVCRFTTQTEGSDQIFFVTPEKQKEPSE